MIRPSHLSVYDPSTPSWFQESIPTCLEDKFGVGLTCQTSGAEVMRNVEAGVRRGGSDDPGSPKPPTDRGWGESRCSGSGVVEQMGKTEYVNERIYVKPLFSNSKNCNSG